MNGRPRASDSRLLQLPAEILADIVDALLDNTEALASLALVNSDCLMLARCAQFAEINFDYSLAKQGLMMNLTSLFVPLARLPGIGSCVRRVTFWPRRRQIFEIHRDLYDAYYGDTLEPCSRAEQDWLRARANSRYMKVQKFMVSEVSTSMPNLKVVVWRDSSIVDKEFLWYLFNSPAEHVKLDGVTFKDIGCLEEPLPLAAWPVRTLDIGISPIQFIMEAVSLETQSTFYRTLFQLCAPTLESLRWLLTTDPKAKISFSSPISFPRLQRLRLLSLNLDASTLASFLSGPLRHLELPRSHLDHCTSALTSCEALPYLSSFVVPGLPKQKEACMHIAQFLAQHTHIEKLCVHEDPEARGEHAHLTKCILPVLANNTFANLRSLSLAWGGGSALPKKSALVPDKALSMIGTFVSLEQLYLRCGMDTGWRYQWLIDHAQLRRHLRSLVKLKILALDRDTYTSSKTDASGGVVQYYREYYRDRSLSPVDYIDARARKELDTDINFQAMALLVGGDDGNGMPGLLNHFEQCRIWEIAHRNRMLTHVEAYAAVLPALEWMYCGQWPIGVVPNPRYRSGPRIAMPLSAARVNRSVYFGETFGIATGDE